MSTGTCDSGTTPYNVGTTQCPLGYYCPFTAGGTKAVEICTPTIDCSVLRLGSKFCDAQGSQEPIVCPEGYYCPTSLLKNVCPEGYYCPVGTSTPIACPPLSICPAGSSSKQELSSIVAVLIIDAAILIVYLIQQRKAIKLFWRRQINKMSRRVSDSNLMHASIPVANEKAKTADASANEANDDVRTNAQLGTKDGEARKNSVMSGKSAMPVTIRDFYRLSREDRELQMRFDFKNMSIRLPTGQTILSGVTGNISAGTVTAIMGPSGAGKTTFMNCLMGKLSRTGGELLINGQAEEMHTFQKTIGYVPQEDIMLRELTVYENIRHSAQVRLPSTWSSARKDAFARCVVEALDLSHVANTCIGDETTRGVSGGQRKRVNIGIEVAAAPLTLFLDEPTSGLDSTSALRVCDMLKQLAGLGVTVVAVIHQPRPEIYEQFDDVLMLAPGGITAYLGPQKMSQAYFEDMGFAFPGTSNPADVLMDILSGKAKRNGVVAQYQVHEITQAWSKKSKRVEERDEKSVAQQEDQKQQVQILKTMCQSRGASFFKQLALCHNRSLVQQNRKLSSLWLELGVAALAGVLIGASSAGGNVYQGVLKVPFTLLSPAPVLALVPLIGLLMGLAVGIAGAPAGVKAFGEERTIFFREAASGHNRVAYFIGKNISVLYRLTIAALHFACLYHLLAAPVITFARLFAIIWVFFFSVYGLSHCVSMLVKREDAPLLAVVASLFAAVFCGYGPSINDFAGANMTWFMSICFPRWLAEAFFTDEVLPFDNIYDTSTMASVFGYTVGRYSTDIGYAVIIGLILRLIAALLMLFTKRKEQR